ncbi:MAG: DsbA family protein [Rhodobacter sp.]|jgi:protein-disulfide isomerase|nr:DsbA family protein [Rhodobacter sp.]
MTQKLSLAAALVLALGAALWLGQSRTPDVTDLGPLAASAQEAATAEAPATAPLAEVPDMVLGNADAPVTLVEYASYTCPHCAAFHDTVFKNLKKDYIDTGKVKFVFREVYFDRPGLWAAMVARCGGETRYFGISSMLFERQKEWAASEDPAVVVENLKKIGRTAGMDDATLQACMENAPMAEAMVARFQENMEKDKVEGTPTLIIDGVSHSNMSYEDLKVILDGKLAG